MPQQKVLFPLRGYLPLLLILFFAWETTASSTVAIRGIQWDPSDTRLRCTIYTDAAVRIEKKDLVSERGIFFVDLYNINLLKPFEKDFYELNNPFLKAVRLQLWPDQKVLRVLFWPQPAMTQRVSVEQNPPRVVIDVSTGSPAATPSVPAAAPKIARPVPTMAPQGKETPESLAPENSKPQRMTDFQAAPKVDIVRSSAQAGTGGSRRKIVIIDPGHGGERDGADGVVRVGSKPINEKEINLLIARRLAGMVQNNHNMTYRMTRSSDQKVGLYDRVQFAEGIAKNANTDCVFVSIHNNMAQDTSAQGIEFYYLEENPARKSEALKELERLENDLDYKDELRPNSMLWNIFMSLEQEKMQERKIQGRQLCSLLEWSFCRNTYFRGVNRGVKGASFVVLRNFNMPAVLVEVGFMSNPDECRKLMQPTFQYNAAAAIYNAVNIYFARQDSSFQPTRYDFK